MHFKIQLFQREISDFCLGPESEWYRNEMDMQSPRTHTKGSWSCLSTNIRDDWTSRHSKADVNTRIQCCWKISKSEAFWDSVWW